MNPILISLGEKIHDALRQFALDFPSKNGIWENLEGGCAVGTFFLHKEAEKKKIPNVFTMGNGHAWLESEGYIYDVTATQFTIGIGSDSLQNKMDQAKKVYVLSIEVSNSIEGAWNSIYKSRGNFFPTSELNIEHINCGWPRGQRPKDYRMVSRGDKFKILKVGRKARIQPSGI